ncbi:TonB-dependent receptor domain-containing protein [Brevundimonas goettingensis]|uniref:TonB-dependent receptor n=1 Tax=Brevundimonas goettingensis TaxID=2774190 RepID=A0A975GX01_9CAUL|nr:TonB-dependent receptor [Brevundimonas goettingensis]QTC90010.1 TonB-dependent receptor [Brevundimonas goettingensis]
MRKHLLASTIFTTAIALGAPALAQTAPAPVAGAQDDTTTVEEVVVTGSRIRRDAVNAPTPLIQISQDQLLTTGQSTVIDYLATIPALSNSVVPSDTTGSNLGDGGLSLPNLRSLGSNRTLTLVDGRRHVGSSGGSLSVDIDTIPRLLIQNVEIVTGGASSVYGADAVSGVLNFILKKDFEGLEVDASYGQINEDGQANRRISALIGKNFFDDRLNVYAHGEYEKIDEVTSLDIDWLRRAPVRIGVDADPTSRPDDGILDARLYTGVSRIDRPRWGQTTLANVQQPSDLTNPNVAYENCFPGGNSAGNFSYSSNCFGVTPGKTFWYDGTTARAANFGQRVGNTGANRPYNIGGDGENPAEFSTGSRVPRSESQRYQVGANFKITDNITAYGEAKYVTEDTFDVGQPTFFDIDLVNSYGSRESNPIYAVNNFDLRWSDNAFLPQNVKDAIRTNLVTPYSTPTATTPGTAGTPFLVQNARHSMFGPDRTQDNTRDLQRYVAGVSGDLGDFGFVKNLDFDIGYTYGKVEVENFERGVDSQRFALAIDSVVDTAGVMGTPGAIVCRAQIIARQGGVVTDYNPGTDNYLGDLRDTAYGQAAINSCQPLNVFGKGNQSQAALDYVDATIHVTERNEQQQGIASISGNLWDFWGAGAIGVALGGEYRKETTEATGRDRDTAGRMLFLNTGPDFPEASYDSKEFFAELSVPLFRDTFLGEYAELSGSYRYADYSTVGNTDVYGVNLVYRPIQDITFKTSYNTSIRVPDLGENFAPNSQTFANGIVDPCTTLNIAAVNDAETRTNRINNCTALAAAQGLTFDFAGLTPQNTDDFRPNYTSGIAGLAGGNPNLKPEESDSFTFSVALRPRFIPNFSLVLDYYEINIDDVIAAVSADTAAANCVNGATLNSDACSTIFRTGGVSPFAVGSFIERSFNYAALKTRGLDFNARYRIDTEEMFGRNFGQFDYSLGGSWLITQQQYLNESDPSDYDELASTLFYPRVRMTSSLTWTPNETWSVNWTADWQTSQNIVFARDYISNMDSRQPNELSTGNFVRNDFTFRYNVNDDLALRAGVVNAFDAEQAPYLGTTLYSNFDPYGRRFFIGLNYKAW